MINRKTTAMILLTSMLFGMAWSFSSCKKNNKPRSSNAIIKEDDPWYKANTFKPFEIMDPYNDIKSPQCSSVVIGDKVFIAKTGSYYYDNIEDYSYAQMYGLFDLEGNYICSSLMEREYDFGNVEFVAVTADGDDMNITFAGNSDEYNGYGIYSMRWDTDSNTLEEPKIADYDFDGDYLIQYVSSDDIVVFGEFSYTDESQLSIAMSLNVFENKELICRIDLSETKWPFLLIDDVYEKDGKIIIESQDGTYSDYYTGEKARIIIDKQSGTVEEMTSSYSSGYYNHVVGFDGRIYVAKSDGIYCDDELYLSYADCDVNLTDMLDLRLLSVEEDTIVLSGYDIDELLDMGLSIITLEKQTRNPNAGKMIINALSATELKNEEYEAILRYNRADNKYFIKPVVRCVTETELFTSEQLQEYYDSLAQEIKSDTGPDLVFNAYVLSSFLNDSYFLDLSKDIEFKDSDYYSEIYDITATDGKHYLIPSGFLINGVMVSQDYLEKGQHGFTYDEYKEFVSKFCDDLDPITYPTTRKRYLELLLNSMGTSWLKDGKVDFNTEEFRALLTYAKESIPATEYEDDLGYFTEDLYMNYYDRQAPDTSFLSEANFGMYTSELLSDPDQKLCGIPSYERTGPVAQVVSSVSVCANTGVKDGCIDFIKYLLGTEVQLNNEYISVNKKAMNILQSSNYQNDVKEFKDNLAKFQSEAQDRDDNYYDPLKETHDRVYSLTDDFESADVYDMTIVYIILEESRGYLDGEKDLDTVIDSINTKVQSYLDSL